VDSLRVRDIGAPATLRSIASIGQIKNGTPGTLARNHSGQAVLRREEWEPSERVRVRPIANVTEKFLLR
jgi:hypothetical protein